MIALTLVLQIGMLPLLARDFHRVTLSGLLANLIALPLTGILVPLGFATLIVAIISQPAGLVLGIPLKWLTALLIHAVDWIAQIPGWSYRIPGPPLWLVLFFSCASIILAAGLREPWREQLRSAWPAGRWCNPFSLAMMLAAAAMAYAALAVAAFQIGLRRYQVSA